MKSGPTSHPWDTVQYIMLLSPSHESPIGFLDPFFDEYHLDGPEILGFNETNIDNIDALRRLTATQKRMFVSRVHHHRSHPVPNQYLRNESMLGNLLSLTWEQTRVLVRSKFPKIANAVDAYHLTGEALFFMDYDDAVRAYQINMSEFEFNLIKGPIMKMNVSGVPAREVSKIIGNTYNCTDGVHTCPHRSNSIAP